MIIVTAGHVDHGKSALLRALTGAVTDRLPEEKRRGMTVDLGYAYLPLPDDGEEGGDAAERVLGFIDVPGHEKFLANMLAGAGGVAHALLIVACDDGIMAQTREHLAILQLLRIEGLTVVLSKADKVDAARLAAVRDDVAAALPPQRWPGVSFFPVSSITGDGIEALREHLIALSKRQQPGAAARARKRFRLAIDRAFHVHGAGLVVTGTAFGGTVRVGDHLFLAGADGRLRTVRVRGLHAQDRPADSAHAGQRIALNLAGDAHKGDIARGDWLLSEAPPAAAGRCLVELDLAAPDGLHHWQSVHVHHAASHTTGRLSFLQETALGDGGGNGRLLAELVLDAPLHLADDDLLIVRDIGAKTTLAGARVLSLFPPRRGKRQPAFLNWLRQRAATESGDDAAVLALWLQQGSVFLPAFAWSRQIASAQLAALLEHAAAAAIVKGDYAMDAAHAEQQADNLVAALAAAHQQYPDQLGVGRSRLKRMALPNVPEPLAFAHVERLLAAGRIVNTHGWLHLPEHRLAFSESETALWRRLESLFRDPPCWVRDLAGHAGIGEDVVRALLGKAARLGYVVAVVRDRYYLAPQIARLAQAVRRSIREDEALADGGLGGSETARLRDCLGVGRKLAVQILEFFDRSGFTRRHGNRHLLRDAELFALESEEDDSAAQESAAQNGGGASA